MSPSVGGDVVEEILEINRKGRENIILKRKYFDNVFFFCLGILATKILKWQRVIMGWRYVREILREGFLKCVGDEDF